VIWIANEGEAVTEMEDITESTSTDVFVQFTVVPLSSTFESTVGEIVHRPIVTPLILPFITTVVFLQPYRLTIWLISPFSTVSPGSFS